MGGWIDSVSPARLALRYYRGLTFFEYHERSSSSRLVGVGLGVRFSRSGPCSTLQPSHSRKAWYAQSQPVERRRASPGGRFDDYRVKRIDLPNRLRGYLAQCAPVHQPFGYDTFHRLVDQIATPDRLVALVSASDLLPNVDKSVLKTPLLEDSTLLVLVPATGRRMHVDQHLKVAANMIAAKIRPNRPYVISFSFLKL